MILSDNRLSNIKSFLQRIESKLDNYLGSESISSQEREELVKIKYEMKNGDFHTFNEVFE